MVHGVARTRCAYTHVVSIEASEVDVWTPVQQQIATALAVDVT